MYAPGERGAREESVRGVQLAEAAGGETAQGRGGAEAAAVYVGRD